LAYPSAQVATDPTLRAFCAQIRAAATGGWPIATSGGFVATAWESTFGTFVCIENPMQAGADGKPAIHTPRRGSVTIRVPGLAATPVVIDLCGLHPDPQRLPDAATARDGDHLTILLDWPKGDARLFWIAGSSQP